MTDAAEFFGFDEEEIVINEAYVRRQVAAKRKTLANAESHLRAMMLQAETMKRRLVELEGVSLGGILSRIKGDRAARVKEMRTALEKHLRDYEASARALSGVQGELATLERQLATLTRRVMPSNIRIGSASTPNSLDRPAPSRGARPILILRPRPG